MLSITNNGKQTLFEYDGWGNLAKATYPDGKVELRNPDKTGNLFATVDRIDRKYSTGGRLEQSKDWTYKYNDEGHLTEKRHRVQVQQAWKYRWNDAGMLEEVVRPDGSTVSFKYDALGRRIEKRLFNRKTRWVWDSNVPLHEWNEVYMKDFTEERGEFYNMKPSKTTTWLFEEGTFVPNGKLVGEESFSIQSNYLGTPEVMYNADGKMVWSAELDAYGDVQELTGERTDCPFRYQGQYEDKETGLYYNRFRYYSAEEGIYISQDPIATNGGIYLYEYVKDANIDIDVVGLKSNSQQLGENLVSIGEIGSTNEDAHHIVMAGSKDDRMEKLRTQMENFNPPIHVNDAENGVWLPRTSSDKKAGRVQTSHKSEGLHSDDYKQNMFDRLNGKNRKDFLEELNKIKREMKKGTSFQCKK